MEVIYQVRTSYLCAAYVVKDGRVVACAPTLRKRLAYWMTVAVRVQPPESKLVSSATRLTAGSKWSR